MPNSPELVRVAQSELVRLGCFDGKIDGVLNGPTNAALSRYMKIEGLPGDNIGVTEMLITELNRHTSRVCPIECKTGQILKGETCIADEKRKPATSTASRKDDDEDEIRPRRKQSAAKAARDEPRRAKIPSEAPRARQQAVARPSVVSGGRSGGSTMIGVGF
jgi:hypothetical protein